MKNIKPILLSIALAASYVVAGEDNLAKGDSYRKKLKSIVIKGSDKQKAEQVNKAVELLQNAMEFYSLDAKIKSEKGEFPLTATLNMGGLFLDVADIVANQKINTKSKEDAFAERIAVLQQLPSYYEQASPIFKKGVDQAREMNIVGNDVVAIEDAYISTYYLSCKVFYDVGNAFVTAPMPDLDAIVKEYVKEGLSESDAFTAAAEEIKEYQAELTLKFQQSAAMAETTCQTGLKAAEHYGIRSESVKKIKDLMAKFTKK